ncbi:MAG: hypothetical protein M3482_01160, partial [Actinomycetota bacterium]|nr:hypothetical protein [Actinomycetota bacterium]
MRVVSEIDHRARGPGTRQEEADSLVWHEWRNGPNRFAADAQALTAGGEEPQARAATQETLGHLSCGGDHVLAVVEHEQQVPLADHLGEPVRVRQVEGGGDRRGNAGGITDGRQLNEAPT